MRDKLVFFLLRLFLCYWQTFSTNILRSLLFPVIRFANQTAFEMAVNENVPGEILSLLEPDEAARPVLCVLPGRGSCATAAIRELVKDSNK